MIELEQSIGLLVEPRVKDVFSHRGQVPGQGLRVSEHSALAGEGCREDHVFGSGSFAQ